MVLSMKGAFDNSSMQSHEKPEEIRASIEECLRISDGRKTIDLFEMGYVDPRVPIETEHPGNFRVREGRQDRGLQLERGQQQDDPPGWQYHEYRGGRD